MDEPKEGYEVGDNRMLGLVTPNVVLLVLLIEHELQETSKAHQVHTLQVDELNQVVLLEKLELQHLQPDLPQGHHSPAILLYLVLLDLSKVYGGSTPEQVLFFLVGPDLEKLSVVVSDGFATVADHPVPNVECCLSLLLVSGEEAELIEPIQELFDCPGLLILPSFIDDEKQLHVPLQTGSVFLNKIEELALQFVIVPS